MDTLYFTIKQYFSKLLLLLLIFVGSGLALSFSISYSYSILQGRAIGDESMQIQALSLFFKQLIATIVGLAGILYLLKTPTASLRKYSSLFAIIAGIAMIYTAFVGPEINGSHRWIVIAGISLQTGDFARIALILYLSDLFAQYHRALFRQIDDGDRRVLLKKLFIRLLIALTVYGGTLYLQRDYSSFMISAIVIMAMVLVSDMPGSWKMSGAIGSIVLFMIIVLSSPNRMERIFQYLQPHADPLGAGFQIQKSYEIIRSGGLLGGGIGSNMLSVLRLPYFNNDFVFSIIIGEYGLLGALTVLSFFGLLCIYSFKLGNYLYRIDRYYYFLLLAATVNLLISAVAHIAVTIGLIPTAGLNLPFYSSGGSSMVTSLLSYGLILRAAMAVYYHKKHKHSSLQYIDVDNLQQDITMREIR